jgi:hypothetical protein
MEGRGIVGMDTVLGCWPRRRVAPIVEVGRGPSYTSGLSQSLFKGRSDY